MDFLCSFLSVEEFSVQIQTFAEIERIRSQQLQQTHVLGGEMSLRA